MPSYTMETPQAPCHILIDCMPSHRCDTPCSLVFILARIVFQLRRFSILHTCSIRDCKCFFHLLLPFLFRSENTSPRERFSHSGACDSPALHPHSAVKKRSEQPSSNSQGVRVPKLRFRDGSGKEFPPYCQESVGTLFYHISRRNNEMANKNVITNSAEFGLIHQRLFFDKDIAVEGNTEKYYIIEQGDFVYNPRKSTTAPYGPFNCYQGDEEGIVSPLYTCLKPLHKEFTNYLLWYFRSSAWYSYVYHNGAQGGARHDRVGMTNELMDGIPVNLPCLEEQEKVSKFLSLIEQRIEKQRQLVEALKSYKRGSHIKEVLYPSCFRKRARLRRSTVLRDLLNLGNSKSGVKQLICQRRWLIQETAYITAFLMLRPEILNRLLGGCLIM